MWRGIRARITVLAVVAVIVVLVVAAVVLLAIQRRILTDNLDDTLSAQASELVRSIDAGEATDPLPPGGDDDAIAQITSANGDVIAATANYSSQPALPLPPTEAGRLRTASLRPAESEFRILSRRAGENIVHVASPTDDIDESIAALRLGLLGAIPVVTAILAALIWWLVGRTLRPVEAIRREVAAITGTNLHRRVPEPAGHDEIQRLARTMNAMLDRVEQAASSQQRFVADASHELRSPLTRIRSELEVDLAHPDTADLVATQLSVLEEIEQMQRLVDDLLVLARHDDHPSGLVARTVVDLDDIVLDEIQHLHRANGIGIGIDASAVSAAQVSGDAGQLARVVRNLFDNAVRHARTTVTATLFEDADVATLTISDDGPGIAVEDHERVFERFTRLDFARAADDGGTGLGLAIARAIILRHSGTIQIDPHHHPGARFVVHLPPAAIPPEVKDT